MFKPAFQIYKFKRKNDPEERLFVDLAPKLIKTVNDVTIALEGSITVLRKERARAKSRNDTQYENVLVVFNDIMRNAYVVQRRMREFMTDTMPKYRTEYRELYEQAKDAEKKLYIKLKEIEKTWSQHMYEDFEGAGNNPHALKRHMRLYDGRQ